MTNDQTRTRRLLAAVPVCNHFRNDNRVLRTCEVLRDLGYGVTVLAIRDKELPNETVISEGIRVVRFHSKAKTHLPKWRRWETALGYLSFMGNVACWINKHRPSVIHVNDWEPVLAVWASRSFGRRPVVYDTHELFQDLEHGRHPRQVARAVAAIDRWGLRASDCAICVNGAIRKELQRLTDRPVHVVRNIPKLVDKKGVPDPDLVARFKDGRKHLVLLGAANRPRCGIVALEILKHLPDEFALAYLAPDDRNALEIRSIASELGLDGRVLFHPQLPHDVLFPTIRHAHAGISSYLPEPRTMQVVLPNKFFEYLHAGLPVVSATSRPQAEILEATGFGISIDPTDPRGAAAAIADWQPNRPTHAALIKHGLTWQAEREQLRQIYASFLPSANSAKTSDDPRPP